LENVNRELSTLFNSIDEIFFSVNMVTLTVIQVSDTCEKLYGYTQSEFMANYKLWLDIIHPDDKHLVETEDAEMRRGEKISNQYRIIRKDKMIRWVETRITPTLDDDGILIRVDGISRDITDSRNAKEELHKSEERYRQIVETAQEGIWLIDENNYISFFNKKMCEILGYSEKEMKGKHLFDFMDEEGKKNALSQIEKGKQKINGNYDVKYITKSGKPIWANISTNSVFSAHGQYNGALAMVTDITRRKSGEELLHQSEIDLAIKNKDLERKNTELEQFAYVASHDLQEPLSTTISFVELFKQKYEGKLDAKADAYLTYIVQASRRMRVLIKDLLDFSRIGHSKDFEKVDCNVILKNVMADLDKIIKDSGAEITSERLPVLTGYSTELKQLFQNLIVNSIKFGKKNVFPKINITTQKNNDYWQFAFSDNGIGIDQQHSERIFIIFQRLHTRAEYEGSGIGLSHCKKIVELHRGKLWVESTPNKGSTFYFTIHSPKENTHETEIKLHHAHR
ncbi:MAG: PAS domain S-box protein, partial [Ginsengibacter sp.]